MSFWSFPQIPKGPQSNEALMIVPWMFVTGVLFEFSKVPSLTFIMLSLLGLELVVALIAAYRAVRKGEWWPGFVYFVFAVVTGLVILLRTLSMSK